MQNNPMMRMFVQNTINRNPQAKQLYESLKGKNEAELKQYAMNERLKRIRQENPDFDKKFVDKFAERMPDLLNIMLDGEEYDCHIGTKEVAMLAEQFITDNKDRKIGFHWTYDEVISTIKNFINLDDAEFYPCDIFVWANVKYGDMSHITSDAGTILKYAISELNDSDFPFYPASQRAYHWLKRHIENEA